MAKAVYEATRSYPKEEVFGLVSQMRRAAVSIPSNIAEGAARQGSKEFIHFLYLALGSASELDTHVEISRGIGMGDGITLKQVQASTAEVSRLLQGLIRSVKAKQEATATQS